MKAFLLAAGLGTRLRPITNSIPKCLVQVCDKPLLHWWIKLFEKHNVDEVLINLHHLPDAVKSYLNSYSGPVVFKTFYEHELLGSAATIRENKDFVADEDSFFICYADNLTNYNLSQMLQFHNEKRASFTLSLFETDRPKEKGIVELDENQKVISFEEKPENPKSNLANAGVYIADNSIFSKINSTGFADIGYDLIPKMIGNLYGWPDGDFLMDIGTHQHLKEANKNCQKLIQGI